MLYLCSSFYGVDDLDYPVGWEADDDEHEDCKHQEDEDDASTTLDEVSSVIFHMIDVNPPGCPPCMLFGTLGVPGLTLARMF